MPEWDFEQEVARRMRGDYLFRLGRRGGADYAPQTYFYPGTMQGHLWAARVS